jgi:hypothetical protein
MLAQLAEAKVPLQQLKHNPHKVAPIGPSLSALLSKNAELKAFAQSGLVSYCRSVYLQPNKAVFDAAALPLEVRQKLSWQRFGSRSLLSSCWNVKDITLRCVHMSTSCCCSAVSLLWSVAYSNCACCTRCQVQQQQHVPLLLGSHTIIS